MGMGFSIFCQVQDKQQSVWRATHRFGFKSQRTEPCNLSTTSSLVIDRRCKVNLVKKANPCLRIKEHKQEQECNQFADERLISRVGVSQTDKTVKLFLTKKSKQNSNPNVGGGY
jgi:hypothetical protein